MIWMFAGMAASAIKGAMEAEHEKRMQDIQNESRKAYNKAVLASSAKQLNEVNLQRTVSRAQTAQALDATRRGAVQETSSRNLQSAASDTMGTSVTQNLDDVSVQLGAATTTLMQNQGVQEASFNSAIQKTTDSAANGLQSMLTGAGDNQWSATLGSAVGTIGTSIAANKMAGKTWDGQSVTPATSTPKATAAPAASGGAGSFLSRLFG